MTVMGFQHRAVAFERNVLARAALGKNPVAPGLLQATAHGRFRAGRAGRALVAGVIWSRRTWSSRTAAGSLRILAGRAATACATTLRERHAGSQR